MVMVRAAQLPPGMRIRGGVHHMLAFPRNSIGKTDRNIIIRELLEISKQKRLGRTESIE